VLSWVINIGIEYWKRENHLKYKKNTTDIHGFEEQSDSVILKYIDNEQTLSRLIYIYIC
jgi:hypothetical protein